MIDQKRVEQFRKEMAALYESLHFQEFYEISKAKIIDALARGNLDGSMSEIKRHVKKLFHPQFADYLDNVFERYADVLAVVNSNYAGLGIDITRDMQKVQALEAVNNSRFGKYEDATVREIAHIVRKGMIKRQSWKEIAKQIGGIDNKANFYADTLGRTLVKGYGREGKTIKANIAGVTWFEYVGIMRPNTRPFCAACRGAHFSSHEIRLSKNGQMSPVSRFCGGYNCHHDLEPDPDYSDKDGRGRGFHAIDKRENRREIRFWGTDSMERIYDGQKKRLMKKKKR